MEGLVRLDRRYFNSFCLFDGQDHIHSMPKPSFATRTDSDSWSSGMDMGLTLLSPDVVGQANEQGTARHGNVDGNP